MQEFVLENYLWIKALHIISVICWMAGLLYLPRLFVYHAQANQGSDLDKTLKVMEVKLLRYIMNPSMIATFLFGGLLIFSNDLMQGWLHAKIFLIIIMAASHGMMGYYRKRFANSINTKSHKFFRILNEIPTILMIIIVILAVVKPF